MEDLNCKSLMIGDWVIYKGEHTLIYEIDDYYERINTEPDGYDSIKYINVSEIEPIPLTSEILEKNGFKHYLTEEGDDNFDYTEGNLGYCLNRTTDGYMSCIDVTHSFTITGLIKYVHELQHILHLCGIEKEIVL